MAYLCGDDSDMVSSSRLYEMMEDHSLSNGELTFPIMGHPFWISVGRRENKQDNLNFTTCIYPGSSVSASDLCKVSFVNWQAVSIADHVRRTRYARLNSSSLTVGPTPATGAVKHYAGAMNYKVISALPAYEHNVDKIDDITSSHAVLIHVPQYPMLDGSTEKTICMADVTLETFIDVDISKVRNNGYTDFGCLGEIWDNVIDAENNPYVGKDKGLDPVAMRNNREQW